jgi:hypothetical protein
MGPALSFKYYKHQSPTTKKKNKKKQRLLGLTPHLRKGISLLFLTGV